MLWFHSVLLLFLRAVVFGHDLSIPALAWWLQLVDIANLAIRLMSIVIVLRIFLFIYCIRRCLLFTAFAFCFYLSFSSSFRHFLVNLVSLILSSRPAPMLLRHLRPFLHATAHCNLSWSKSHDMASIWVLAGSMRGVLQVITRRYIIINLLSIASLRLKLGLTVGATWLQRYEFVGVHAWINGLAFVQCYKEVNYEHLLGPIVAARRTAVGGSFATGLLEGVGFQSVWSTVLHFKLRTLG